MSPRPAPDLDLRRDQVIRAARDLAESDGWAAVTMRRLAGALEGVDASPMARTRAYLDFAAAHPRVYEAMFSLPSGLSFGTDDTPEPLRRAFRGIRDAFPAGDETQ